jgi:hypothetical protein
VPCSHMQALIQATVHCRECTDANSPDITNFLHLTQHAFHGGAAKTATRPQLRPHTSCQSNPLGQVLPCQPPRLIWLATRSHLWITPCFCSGSSFSDCMHLKHTIYTPCVYNTNLGGSAVHLAGNIPVLLLLRSAPSQTLPRPAICSLAWSHTFLNILRNPPQQS